MVAATISALFYFPGEPESGGGGGPESKEGEEKHKEKKIRIYKLQALGNSLPNVRKKAKHSSIHLL